jgi:hypothetical protein
MRKLICGLAGVGILVIIFGTIYGVAQQVQRSDANQPQIQISEDTAAQISSSYDPHIASTFTPVDMRASLAPFTIVYDKTGRVVSGSGYLNGRVPKAPLGILKAAQGKTYNAVTWQLQKGTRIAAVTVAIKNYYVLSGRSLTEVEKNETHTLQLSMIGGVLSLLLLGIAVMVRAQVVEHRPHL